MGAFSVTLGDGGAPEGAGAGTQPAYVEDFVARDAVYTVRSVDFVPPNKPELNSLFDDSPIEIDETWKRTVNAGIKISSASEEAMDERVRKASAIVHEMAEPKAS
jgi:hypothetical protein